MRAQAGDFMASYNQRSRYRAFLLRCWQERSRQQAQPTQWRFSLENAHNGVRHGFASFEAVIAALQQELADSPAALSDAPEHATAQNKQE
jgi:hypothetical protein